MKYISTVASCRTEELSGDNSLNFYWLSLNQPCFWTDEGGLFMFRYQGSCCCILFVLYLMYVGVFSRDSRVCSGSNRVSLYSCVLIWSLSFVVFLSVVHQGVVFVFVVVVVTRPIIPAIVRAILGDGHRCCAGSHRSGDGPRRRTKTLPLPASSWRQSRRSGTQSHVVRRVNS